MQFSSHKKRWLDNTIEGAYSHCNKMLQITQKLEEREREKKCFIKKFNAWKDQKITLAIYYPLSERCGWR